MNKLVQYFTDFLLGAGIITFAVIVAFGPIFLAVYYDNNWWFLCYLIPLAWLVYLAGKAFRENGNLGGEG